MRHRLSGRKLGRTSSHRRAMFANMAVALVKHEQITTTLPKAKELRRVAEPILTLGKNPSLANRRLAFARLRDREMVTKLISDLGGKIESFYYMFGTTDVVTIAEVPDEATAAAVSLVVGASGAAHINTTVLLDPEVIDQATHKSIPYRPPA